MEVNENVGCPGKRGSPSGPEWLESMQ